VTLVLLVLFGCSGIAPEPSAALSPWRPHAERPALVDDLDRQSLLHALHHSLDYVRRLPPERSFPFGDRRISVATLQHTLETFQQVVSQAATGPALQAALSQHFELVQAAGRDGRGDVLFTGYYEMTLPASLVPTAEFVYPLYTVPPDLPSFTRREIDTEGKLRGRQLELAWLQDAIEGFFLHVQGSGKLHLSDGRTFRVQYAASNGHPYRSIGRLLIDEGRIAREAMSLQSIRRYLRDHPEERTRVLNANPRYVFFRRVEQGPHGSLNVPLVPGRSIATDHRLFPPAGVAFIQTQQPVFNGQGEITSWQPLSRFVFNHDTGGAITGPGRVDVFWGSGALAEMAAGHMQHPGRLFFLLPRRASTKRTSAMP
jgi:membrane-bound lytic murein transglycosylase A